MACYHILYYSKWPDQGLCAYLRHQSTGRVGFVGIGNMGRYAWMTPRTTGDFLTPWFVPGFL